MNVAFEESRKREFYEKDVKEAMLRDKKALMIGFDHIVEKFYSKDMFYKEVKRVQRLNRCSVVRAIDKMLKGYCFATDHYEIKKVMQDVLGDVVHHVKYVDMFNALMREVSYRIYSNHLNSDKRDI